MRGHLEQGSFEKTIVPQLKKYNKATYANLAICQIHTIQPQQNNVIILTRTKTPIRIQILTEKT